MTLYRTFIKTTFNCFVIVIPFTNGNYRYEIIRKLKNDDRLGKRIVFLDYATGCETIDGWKCFDLLPEYTQSSIDFFICIKVNRMISKYAIERVLGSKLPKIYGFVWNDGCFPFRLRDFFEYRSKESHDDDQDEENRFNMNWFIDYILMKKKIEKDERKKENEEMKKEIDDLFVGRK